jgi:hypothetical protein
MTGNDRIRARLERLYGFYTNQTERLFDIGVTPGGHNDNPELRLMAYRWINWHLKGTNAPVTEPEFPPIEGKRLRAFPDELPADEVNTKIDEQFVPLAANALPQTRDEFQDWRKDRLKELERLVFRPLAVPIRPFGEIRLGTLYHDADAGWPETEPGLRLGWTYSPPEDRESAGTPWLVVLDEEEAVETPVQQRKPEWVTKLAGNAGVVLVSPRGTGPQRWSDPAPFYIQRALALLGCTVDSGRVTDVRLAASQILIRGRPEPDEHWVLAGRGRAGIIAVYAALFEFGVAEVVLVDPPTSHRDGPVFLNVMRVVDIPEALGLLAPRPVTIYTDKPAAFERTRQIYQAAGGTLAIRPRP